ncbi:SCUBE2 [Branchiostoma lanceolatum]|uniref:SCUBE2 protein n=1 Tax=Branchiostoma lanceolatum TaxID=7740 RepID=A0A8K0ABJ9_BRALA|nr:SCUBE2 [Branchiostoma lanceolatum]
MIDFRLFFAVVSIWFSLITSGGGQGNHAFEVLLTANQQYNGVSFFAINARLPADGLSNTSDWCRDYQNLCAEYGLKPTGCGEDYAVQGGSSSHPDKIRCVTEYNSDPYINNVLGCSPVLGVRDVASLAFSASNTGGRSFGFYRCSTSNCQRGIRESAQGLYNTEAAFPQNGSGDGIVYTVCAGSTENGCARENGGCAQNCTTLPGGRYNCSCMAGFVLMEDRHGCTEPDECATVNGRCDHICSNVPGGYRCQCRQGFVLMADAHGCGVCGRCQGGDVNCDPMSGVCSAGCQDGWKTQLCDKAVDPPLDLAVTDVTDEGFKVTWSPSPDLDLEGYRVVVSKLDMTTVVNKTSDEASFPVVGLLPETDYIIRVTALFSSGGWRSQSEATMIAAATGATPTTTPAPAATTTTPAPAVTTTTPTPAATTKQTSQKTALLTTKPATSTVREAVGDEGSSDEAMDTTPAPAVTTKQTSQMTTLLTTEPATSTVREAVGDEGSSDDEAIIISNGHHHAYTCCYNHHACTCCYNQADKSEDRPTTEPATSTVREAAGDEGSSDEAFFPSAAITPTAAATTEQTSGMTTVLSTRPSTPTVQLGGHETKETSSRPPVGNRATPDQALAHSLDSIYAESVSPSPQDVLQILAQLETDVDELSRYSRRPDLR